MQNKKSKKLQNKNAVEFVMLNRGMDDPNYDNPNAPSKILMYVPKEDEELNKDQKKIIESIPEICRGVFTQETADEQLKQMGIELRRDENKSTLDSVKDRLSELDKKNIFKSIEMELNQKEIANFLKKNEKLSETAEEIEIDTNIPIDAKDLDDNKIDKIFKTAKIKADVVEYNEYGLKKTIDSEVLQYVTNREFREGVDIFIPAPNMANIQENRFDIDINPEDMDDEYKEVYDALRSDDEEDCQKIKEEVEGVLFEKVIKGDELEDDFVMLANDGQLPVELLNEMQDDKVVIAETKSKKDEPNFKFISKEEKEFLDRKFEKTYKEYGNDKIIEEKKPKNLKVNKLMEDAVDEMLGKHSKPKVGGITTKFEDEDEFEDYEIEDDEEGEEYEDYEYEEEETEEEPNKIGKNIKHQTVGSAKPSNLNKNKEDSIAEDDEDLSDREGEDFTGQANINIEYVTSNKGKNKKRKPKKNHENDEFTRKDLNEIINNKDSIGISIGLLESTIKNIPDTNAVESEEDDEGIPEYFAKKRLDITSIQAKIGVLPKTIKGEGEKKEKNNNLNSTARKEINDKSILIESQPELSKIKTNNDDLLLGLESKENKKLRKKLLKEEKREKRIQKKQIKGAFNVK